MKRIITLMTMLILIGCAQQTFAKDGYKIQVKFPGNKDSMVYLAHYYGQAMPKIFKADSAKFDKNGVAVLQSDEKLVGGIYIILLSDMQTFFEFLLDNGDNMTISADAAKLPEGVQFKNAPENERFLEYVTFLKGFGERQQKYIAELKAAKNSIDSTAVNKKMRDAGKELIAYREKYAQKYPNTLLSSIFHALEVPQVPEGTHLLPNGKVDSAFAYNYYKSHYWDGFNFQDDRLIHTPIYDAKLEEYINRLTIPSPDSVIKEGDSLLAKTRGQKNLFKYTLWWLARNTETSKVMGMDEAFIYFVEQYILRGDAYWLDNEAIDKYRDRIAKIKPNVIGNIAPDLVAQDINGKDVPLSSVKAKYTLLVFYSPTCGHCEKEIPKIDSVYEASLKKRGVKVYAFATEDQEKWGDFIKKHDIEDWVNVADWPRKSGYYSKFDVYSTPVIYLLDEKKIIRGKRLDHSNIEQLIDMIEKKEKTTSINK